MQYVEGLRGEPAGRRLVATADRRLQQKSDENCGLDAEKPRLLTGPFERDTSLMFRSFLLPRLPKSTC